MNVYSTVCDLFADSHHGIRVYPGGDGSARIALDLDLVGTAAANGGDGAGAALTTIGQQRLLSVSTLAGGVPGRGDLLRGDDVVVTGVPSWRWLVEDVPDPASVADLVGVTGLATSTVRNQLREWKQAGVLVPAPGFGPHGDRRYPLGVVRELVARMPGRGNRVTGAPKIAAARMRHAQSGGAE